MEALIGAVEDWRLPLRLADSSSASTAETSNLEIDLETTGNLLPRCPPDCVRVAESGIFTAGRSANGKSGADAVS